MVEQICPRCKEGNPLDNVYCGQCGARLAGEDAARGGSELTVGSGRLLPAQSMQQVGRAVAVSVAALVAEAGLSWLRRRLERVGSGTPADVASTGVDIKKRPKATIVGRRVLRVWRNGALVSEAVEDSVWEVEE